MLSTGLRPASIVIGLSLATLPAAGQSQLWIRQIGTSNEDYARAATPDGAGGVYLSGETQGSLGGANAGNWDAWLALFSSTGERVWIRQFGTGGKDFAYAASADGSGGVYVGGGTSGSLGGPFAGTSDAWLARYDPAGNPLWIRQFGAGAYEAAFTAAPDGSGGVFVGGSTGGDLGGPSAGGLTDAWFARYDPAGNQLWIRQVGTSNDEGASGVAGDGSGGVYVSGTTKGGLGGPSAGLNDVWIARYDGSGSRLWIRQIGTAANDTGGSAAPNGTGGVYVCGVTLGSLGGPSAGGWDAWVASYDGMGNQLWIRQFGTSASDGALEVSHDAGGLFLSGNTWGSLGGPNAGGDDAWLARYDSNGLQIWIQQLGTNCTDLALAASPDSSGGLYVGGTTCGSLGGPFAGGIDAWLARYDGSCNPGKTYCTASTTSLPGCTASLTATGPPTLSDPTAWSVSTTPIPAGNLGLLLFGSSGADNTPYGTLGGKLCVAAPTFRTSPKQSGGDVGQCNGAYAFTLADLIAAAPVVTSGATVNVQVWARDPANADGFLLSDGLEVVICP